MAVIAFMVEQRQTLWLDIDALGRKNQTAVDDGSNRINELILRGRTLCIYTVSRRRGQRHSVTTNVFYMRLNSSKYGPAASLECAPPAQGMIVSLRGSEYTTRGWEMRVR